MHGLIFEINTSVQAGSTRYLQIHTRIVKNPQFSNLTQKIVKFSRALSTSESNLRRDRIGLTTKLSSMSDFTDVHSPPKVRTEPTALVICQMTAFKRSSKILYERLPQIINIFYHFAFVYFTNFAPRRVSYAEFFPLSRK